MVTNSMNFEEIQNELISDLRNNNISYRGCLKLNNKYRRAALKAKGVIMFEPFVYETERKNTFYFVPYTYGKKHFKDNGMCFIIVSFFYTNHGLCVGMGVEKQTKMNFYFPHLFKRYAERYEGMETLEGVGLKRYAMRWLVENTRIIALKVPSEKYGEFSICGHVKHGLVFGNVVEGNCLVFKTFVSTDMLGEQQIEIKESTERALHEYEKKELAFYKKSLEGRLRKAI